MRFHLPIRSARIPSGKNDRPKRRRATTAVLVLSTLPVMLGMAALTIDLGYLYNVRGDLQQAVDSAALAGASALSISPSEVRSRAIAHATLNHAGGAPVDISNSDVQLGDWNPNTATFTPIAGEQEFTADAVRVTARLTSAGGNPVTLFFASVFGKQTSDVSASATAQFGTAQTWDVMIVQDKSGSFTGALELAKEADRALVSCLKDHINNASQVGFVTYTGTAKVVVPLSPLDTSYALIDSAISSLQRCCWFWCNNKLRCNTGTNIAVAVDLAVDQLVNSSSDPEIGKAIIIVSDGRPQGANADADAVLRQLAVDSVDNAAANNISVYGVYYAGSSGTPGSDAAFLQSLIRGKGSFQQTPIADELSSLVWKICASLPLMIVQ